MTPDHEAAEVAKGLTRAQDKAVRAAAPMNSILYGPGAFEVRAGGATVAMYKKGLIREREWRKVGKRS